MAYVTDMRGKCHAIPRHMPCYSVAYTMQLCGKCRTLPYQLSSSPSSIKFSRFPTLILLSSALVIMHKLLKENKPPLAMNPQDLPRSLFGVRLSNSGKVPAQKYFILLVVGGGRTGEWQQRREWRLLSAWRLPSRRRQHNLQPWRPVHRRGCRCRSRDPRR